MTKIQWLLILAFLFSGCTTSPPLDLKQVDHTLTPLKALNTRESVGRSVLWGGMILSSMNFENYTQLEVLSYPVDREGRVKPRENPQWRFQVRYPGYLETSEYARNRWVTVVGVFRGVEDGLVGDAKYPFPVVDSKQIYLWPEESLQSTSPQLHFGVGVIFH